MKPSLKRSAFVFPAIAAVVVALIIAFVGPFNAPVTRAASSLAFNATFNTSSDFYDRFDYGFSGISPLDPGMLALGSITNFHGDHDTSCGAPTTDRNVAFGGTGPNTDFSQLFWYCAPGGDGTKGHVMTGVDTIGYNTAWFAPKGFYTNVDHVCWDINETQMSSRKWTQVLFESQADATRYPTGSHTVSGGNPSTARGTGGFDLGYTSPEFRVNDPNNGLFPQGGTLAGLKDMGGTFQWFQNQDNWSAQPSGDTFFGWPGVDNVTDKAARYQHCVANQPNNMIRVTEQSPNGLRTIDIPGQIPQGPVRVVFEDDNYHPSKDEARDSSTVLTWHWDNIQVFTDSDQPTTTTAPPTTEPPTTAPPTTEPPTTEPPTTMPPTTEPPTTAPPTTAPPTTAPPTTAPPTTEPPTTEPPTTEPPTTEPPTTMPPTTEPPTTEPPTTEPPTTEPPTTEPPTTMPPTTEPPTTEPPSSTTPPSTSAPDAPVVNITSGPEGTTTDPNATIMFEVIDGKSSERAPLALTDGATVTCSLDGAPAETCTSPVHYQGLSLGEHKVVVTATDGANDTGSATHVWSVVAVSGSTTDPPPTTTPAPPSVTSALQHGVLPLTGSQSTRLAIVGLMMIMAGLLLGSVFAIGRRLHP